ncbi:MAG: PSP1 domain-containing protein [Phycisphaerales bacterium]
MPIFPLPVFEADMEAARKADEEAYAKLSAPKTMVVRFGQLKFIGEYPYDGDAKPGCGSKLVARTHRGTELVEMLTSTCPNAGCSKSVSRKEILQYIENSGGRDYPFFTEGRILRVATTDDLNKQAALEARKDEMLRQAREIAAKVGVRNMKLVDAEPILGGEKLTFHFTSEDRVDFRTMVMELAQLHHTRIEMRQVGARDEARIIADYEKCGQHCCCKQFLKVLKPVSMKQAKIQKATLDPLKISGRCGRLMCCLRYEETTYDELKRNLPRKKTVVMTPDGPGIVIDSQILTQLVLVSLDSNHEQAAYPLESLTRIDPNAPRATEADDDDDAPEGDAAQGDRPPRPLGPQGRPGGIPRGGPGGRPQGGGGGSKPFGGPGPRRGPGGPGGPPQDQGGRPPGPQGGQGGGRGPRPDNRGPQNPQNPQGPRGPRGGGEPQDVQEQRRRDRLIPPSDFREPRPDNGSGESLPAPGDG